jgi:hypothetical protein
MRAYNAMTQENWKTISLSVQKLYINPFVANTMATFFDKPPCLSASLLFLEDYYWVLLPVEHNQ